MKNIISILSFLSLILIFEACITTDDPGPDLDPRDKFMGTWKVAESCIRLAYEVSVTYDPDNSAQVLIDNFGNPGPGYEPATALIVNDKIFLPNQVIGDNWTANGEGTYINGEIEWTYEITLSGSLLNCTATYFK